MPFNLIESLQETLALQQQGKLEEAGRRCQEILVQVPDNAMATHLFGLVQCQLGQVDQGMAALRRSLTLAPNNPEFHNNLAGVLGQLKRYDEAQQCIREAIRLNPNFGLAHFNLGVNCEHRQELPAAEAAYRRAVALLPGFLEASYRLGCVLHYLERYQESEECHLSVFEPAPKDGVACPVYPELDQPRIVVVVTCKGRLAHLKQTLLLMLQFETMTDYRVVVIDYADPDGSFEWCTSLKHPRLAAVRILDGAELFHKSRAFNCGANVLPSDILCFVDADSTLDPKFLEVATEPVRTGQCVVTHRLATSRAFDTFGVCCVRTAAYRAVKGYDEVLKGYGPEDMDFFARMRQHGGLKHFAAWLYPHALPHSQEARTRFYSYKDTRSSAQQILRRLFDKQRIVNPSGYGRANAQWSSIETGYQIERRLIAPD